MALHWLMTSKPRWIGTRRRRRPAVNDVTTGSETTAVPLGY
jgi:hypothetical protein